MKKLVCRTSFIKDKNRTNQSGFMTAEWSVGIALLLFPSFVLIMTFLQIPTRQSLAQAASSAAARAYVQALDQSQAVTAARAAAQEVVLEQYPSADPSDISVDVVYPTLYCGGNEVSIRVTISAPVILNPFSNYDDVSDGIDISSTSTERIDDYAELADSETGLGPIPSSGYDDEEGRCDSP